MSKRKDIKGRTFGELTAIRYVGKDSCGKSLWEFEHTDGYRCIKRASHVVTGDSLGVIDRHGLSNTPEYIAWMNMKQRCTNPNYDFWHRYGGRGITFCLRWTKFRHFYKDMGPRPSQLHSLDRIDNHKGYSKSNCRWATPKEQANNRGDDDNTDF